MLRSLPLAAILLALALPLPAAVAKGGGDDRDRGSCGRGATSELRVQDQGDGLRMRFRVDTRRGGQSWRVVVTQERRVVLRSRARTSAGGAFRLERRLRDLAGSDTVSVRASGPNGLTCNASVTLWG